MVDVGAIELAPALRAFIEDAPALNEHQAGKLGILVGVATRDPKARFPGAILFESVDQGASYEGVQAFQGQAIAGRLVGLPSTSGICGKFWDNETTLSVELDRADDELSSEATEDVAAGRVNNILVGNEIIGFATATLTASNPNTYTLTNLLRGRRGTERFINDHATDERVLLLTPPSAVKFIELGLNAYMTRRTYKVVASGFSPSDVTDQTDILITGASMKQLSPTILSAYRDASSNCTIRLNPRSRSIFGLLRGIIPRSLDCCCAWRYEIDIWNTGRTAILRTFVVEDTNEFIYTAALQTTDFGAPEATIDVDVYAMGPDIGRGLVATGVV